MRVETTTLPDGTQQQHYIADPGEILVMTGDVSGIKQLPDGTHVDVTPAYTPVTSQEHADALMHQIGMHHVEHGHPRDVDRLTDPDSGAIVPVQRPFVYAAPDGKTHVGVGTSVGEHPLDYQLRAHDEKQAAAGAKAFRALKAKQSPKES